MLSNSLRMNSINTMQYKKLITSLIPVLLVVFVFGMFEALPGQKNFPFTSKNSSNKVASAEETTIFAEHLDPIRLKPIRLYTETKSIDVPLIEVGVTETGMLDSPYDYYVGGWYTNGGRPGELENVIIDGHYDTNFGSPAAFWNLKNVIEGDRIHLVDEVGRRYTYQVNQILYVSIHDPNRIDKLLSGNGGTLTLITCNGVWIPSHGTYNERIIVKAQLIS